MAANEDSTEQSSENINSTIDLDAANNCTETPVLGTNRNSTIDLDAATNYNETPGFNAGGFF